MIKTVLKKDAIIYLVNIALFTLVFIYKPTGSLYVIIFLTILLILSRLFVKQVSSKRNTWRINDAFSINVNAFIMLTLFGLLSFLHWKEYETMELIYLLVFCIIQFSIIRIQSTPEMDTK